VIKVISKELQSGKGFAMVGQRSARVKILLESMED
jgi:hypothetical protein